MTIPLFHNLLFDAERYPHVLCSIDFHPLLLSWWWHIDETKSEATNFPRVRRWRDFAYFVGNHLRSHQTTNVTNSNWFVIWIAANEQNTRIFCWQRTRDGLHFRPFCNQIPVILPSSTKSNDAVSAWATMTIFVISFQNDDQVLIHFQNGIRFQ